MIVYRPWMAFRRRLRAAIHALRLRGTLDGDPRAEVLHGLVVCLLLNVGAIWLPIVWPLTATRRPANLVGVLFDLLVNGVVLVLLNRGRLRPAAWLFLSAAWVHVSALIVLSGGIHSSVLAEYIALPILAAWILGAGAAGAAAAVCMVSALAMAVLEQTGMAMPRYFPGNPFGLWYQFAHATLIASAPLVAILRSLHRALDAQHSANRLLDNVLNSATDCVVVKDRELRTVLCNQAHAGLLGKSPSDLYGKTDIENGWDLCPVQGDQASGLRGYADTDRAALDGRTLPPAAHQATVDGKLRFFDTVKVPLRDASDEIVGILVSSRDFTERKRAEEEKVKLEAQFQHAQRMESVGRLAGGVAHDFNNLLTVINGYSQMLLSGLKPGDPLWENLEEINKAGERAAGLTRQLLAYSRQQVLQLRPLNLNNVVQEMRPMLQRLVGEDLEVRVALNASAGMVQADPHQLDQVVMNLAVNARDAMPQGGKLLIETANVELDESYVETHPGAHLGRCVMLAVSDTGIGMDKETQRNSFEPFFTTKGMGKGTGLGLSTVQGIVAQSGGHIDVYSELGHGTTFKIYLPALAEVTADPGQAPATPVVRGHETVLVVEDQHGVLQYVVAALSSYGYRVLKAENRSDALEAFEQERGAIDLVLTDVIMPNGSGRELAGELEKRQPGLKVLFMSGYTDDAIAQHGVLESGAEFIQKPFSLQQLATKVRRVLG